MAVAFAVLQQGIDINDEESIIKLAKESKIGLLGEPDSLHIFLNGIDISGEIRTNKVGQTASIVSSISEVRKTLGQIAARTWQSRIRLRFRRTRYRNRRFSKC